MAGRALVIGGAGKVGRGVVSALESAGWAVIVVDPAGSGLAAHASAELLEEVGRVDLAVISLPARGEGRAAGSFHPAAVAAAELPGRIDALDLAVGALDGGILIELAGGVLLDPAADEPGLIARWQRGIHTGLTSLGIRPVLCAIDGFVDPDGAGIGASILEIFAAGRAGICRLDPESSRWGWVD